MYFFKAAFFLSAITLVAANGAHAVRPVVGLLAEQQAQAQVTAAATLDVDKRDLDDVVSDIVSNVESWGEDAKTWISKAKSVVSEAKSSAADVLDDLRATTTSTTTNTAAAATSTGEGAAAGLNRGMNVGVVAAVAAAGAAVFGYGMA